MNLVGNLGEVRNWVFVNSNRAVLFYLTTSSPVMNSRSPRHYHVHCWRHQNTHRENLIAAAVGASGCKQELHLTWPHWCHRQGSHEREYSDGIHRGGSLISLSLFKLHCGNDLISPWLNVINWSQLTHTHTPTPPICYRCLWINPVLLSIFVRVNTGSNMHRIVAHGVSFVLETQKITSNSESDLIQ